MSYSAIRTAMKTLLEGVTGIGKVHKYRRHTKFWDEYYKRHVKSGAVNNWEISRVSRPMEVWKIENGTSVEPYYRTDHSIVIYGHMSLKDSEATEETFQDLIESICDAFRLDNTLGGAIFLPAVPQVEIIGHQTYGGVLCHYAEMRYDVTERQAN